MSEENIEVVRQLIAALNARDVDRYLSLCTPEVEIAEPTTRFDGPSSRGPENVRAFFARVEEGSTMFRVEVERIDTAGRDRVLVFAQVKVVSTSGIALEHATTNVYQLSAGKLRRVDVYFDREEALEALRLAD
jgi:ketosteroid isomerase-like protein